MAVNPLSRREVLKFGAYTTVGGALTPGISLAQAIMTDTKGSIAQDEQIEHFDERAVGGHPQPRARRDERDRRVGTRGRPE